MDKEKAPNEDTAQLLEEDEAELGEDLGGKKRSKW